MGPLFHWLHLESSESELSKALFNCRKPFSQYVSALIIYHFNSAGNDTALIHLAYCIKCLTFILSLAPWSFRNSVLTDIYPKYSDLVDLLLRFTFKFHYKVSLLSASQMRCSLKTTRFAGCTRDNHRFTQLRNKITVLLSSNNAIV